ncbi:MAG: AIR synthase related protein [Actinomycetota bacterium]|nr:AIR synthase related protein [Actinomycetota bacterium]
MTELETLAQELRDLPGVRSKAHIALVAEVFGGGDWFAGPGDDGAVLPPGEGSVVVGGEAILPAFVASDPYGAGVAAVLANVNDLAAMGAVPVALLDTVVGPEDISREVLRGMRWAARLYDIPVVGGHLTRTDGPPALSAFGVGRAVRLLSATYAAPGQVLVLACCLEGRMREDFLFFPSFDERGEKLAGDVRLLAELAATGAAVAAKDVSMAGLVGSLAMLLEPGRLGVDLDLDLLPVPDGVPLADWLGCFPCFAFLLTCPPERVEDCVEAFRARGLTAQAMGALTDDGRVRLVRGQQAVTVFDLAVKGVTHLRG